ncbi:unnamed protein product [Amoebophrya sp. A25]|nr:unnamed protein product [Amoebophrya sp. A25]|eukprot:GSA25T00022411001.1
MELELGSPNGVSSCRPLMWSMYAMKWVTIKISILMRSRECCTQNSPSSKRPMKTGVSRLIWSQGCFAELRRTSKVVVEMLGCMPWTRCQVHITFSISTWYRPSFAENSCG